MQSVKSRDESSTSEFLLKFINEGNHDRSSHNFLSYFDSRMIKRCQQVMPRESGLLISSRVSKRPWLFTHHVGGEKLSCQMKGRCMVSDN